MLIILLVAVAACTVFFFKVTEIRLEGDIVKYSKAELLEACPIREGDSVALVSTGTAESRMLSELPYLETVKIKKNFSGIVTVTCTESNEFAAISYESGFAVINSSLKIIDIVGKVPKKSTVIYGQQTVGARPGQRLKISEDNDNSEQLQELLTGLFNAGLGGKITAINIGDKLNIQILYDGRILIQFGTINNAEYKIEMLREVCENQLAASDKGILDVATIGKGTFSPREIEDLVLEMKSKD